MEKNYVILKAILVGDSRVGKTSILSQLTQRKFSSECEPTIGVEFGSKTFEINEKMFKLQIWDTVYQKFSKKNKEKKIF